MAHSRCDRERERDPPERRRQALLPLRQATNSISGQNSCCSYGDVDLVNSIPQIARLVPARFQRLDMPVFIGRSGLHYVIPLLSWTPVIAPQSPRILREVAAQRGVVPGSPGIS